MKKVIRGAWNGRFLDDDRLCKGLLQYRNTPSVRDGLSPAQKLFGHPMQDTIPAHPRSFSQEWQQTKEETEQKMMATQQNTRNYYNKTVHPLSYIQQGSHVVLQNPRTKLWDTNGVVISVDQHRKYHIKIKSGNIVTRKPEIPMPSSSSYEFTDRTYQHTGVTAYITFNSACTKTV